MSLLDDETWYAIAEDGLVKCEDCSHARANSCQNAQAVMESDTGSPSQRRRPMRLVMDKLRRCREFGHTENNDTAFF